MRGAAIQLPFRRARVRRPRSERPLGFVLGRIGYSFLLLFAVSILVFMATQVLPGDTATAILGRATPERVAALREQLGLNEPVVKQYLDWISGVVTGDLGMSLTAGQPVSTLISDPLQKTLLLMFVTSIIAVPAAITLGALSAVKRDSVGDRGGLGLAVILSSLPEFVVGMLLAMVFATTVFHILPAVTIAGSGIDPKGMVLPVTALTISMMPYIYRLTRASTIDALESDYVHVARLKGCSERRALFSHALPNALVPVIQGTGLSLGFLLGGTIIIEFLFAYPGLGSLLLSAIRNLDLPMIQALTLIFGAGYLFFNLLADVLTVLVTPRLRTGTR